MTGWLLLVSGARQIGHSARARAATRRAQRTQHARWPQLAKIASRGRRKHTQQSSESSSPSSTPVPPPSPASSPSSHSSPLLGTPKPPTPALLSLCDAPKLDSERSSSEAVAQPSSDAAAASLASDRRRAAPPPSCRTSRRTLRRAPRSAGVRSTQPSSEYSSRQAAARQWRWRRQALSAQPAAKQKSAPSHTARLAARSCKSRTSSAGSSMLTTKYELDETPSASATMPELGSAGLPPWPALPPCSSTGTPTTVNHVPTGSALVHLTSTMGNA
mmetsp:Transcript_1509/g.4409  ORF Transcript_1509/g.4409 Transcript_1509/m.4409 type:complete len:274 (+) Transcript_1509:147-968(+)